MDETNLNKIMSDSINYNSGFAHKLSDIGSQFSNSKPFDIFGIIEKAPAYIESKLMKDNISAFAFSKIEPHQLINLTTISNQLSTLKHYSLIALGLWKSRDYFNIMFFDIKYINLLIKTGKKSILKKELEELIFLKKYLEVESVTVNNKKIKIVKFDKLDEIIIK